MLREIALAIRSLARQPAFTLAAAATIALGIAASTAVFATVNAALLRPLPFPHAEDIHSLRTTITDGRYTSGLVAPLEVFGLKAASADVEAAALAVRVNEMLVTDAGAFDIAAYGVTHGFFDELFGTRMTLGRAFTPEDHAQGAPRSVVLSHDAWQRYFGGDPHIVGKRVQLSTGVMPIVGVAERGFAVPAKTDLWINVFFVANAIGHVAEGYVRITHGTSIEALEAPMAQVMGDLAIKFPDQNKNRVFVSTSMLDAIVGDLRPVLWILFAATAGLLLIAAVNVTNLMLARTAARAREMGIRTALGASRLRLARQLLTESLLVAVAGGVLGALGAFAGVRLLQTMGAAVLPRLDQLPFDPAVLAFVVAAVLVTAVVVGVAPAFVTARSDIASVINEGGRGAIAGRATRRLLGAMIVAQIAFAVALVSGAGRLTRSFANLLHEDRGFTSEPRMFVDVTLPFFAYQDPARIDAWLAEAGERLRSLGANEVAAASSLPLGFEWDLTTFVDVVSSPTTDPHARPNARLRRISAGFLDAMDIGVVAGREFTEQDRRDSQGVIIVNQAFVRRFLGGRDPLNERLTIPGYRARMVDGRLQAEPLQIVGVAADTRFAALGTAPEQTVYLPHSQSPMRRFGLVAGFDRRNVDDVRRDVAAALRQIDARVPLRISTLGETVDTSLRRQRLGMVLMSVFGAAALALAAVGIFGVVAFVVSQRTGEMAVRLALGASTVQVFWIVVRQGGRLAAAGGLIGLMLAWWTGGLVSRYVHEVNQLDPLVLGVSAASVGLVTAVSIGVLARRAAHISPADALRTGG